MSKQSGASGFEELARESLLYPQEQPALLKNKENHLVIGIPKELATFENRVPITPDAVAVLVANGHEVIVEAGAGDAAHFSDREYSEAGAQIEYSREKVFEANFVLKVEPPTFEELELMKPHHTLVSALPMAKLTAEYIQAVNQKRLTCFAFEFIEDKTGNMPVVRAMSEIAGSTVLLIAAEYLNTINEGRGIILGGITGVPPTKVVIIGAGTVAEYAARTALGLGAEVKIFDNNIYKLRRLKYALGQHVYTSTLNTLLLREALSEADVAIGAVRAQEGRTPCIVTEDMVRAMKPNSVIIDVSIDQGGVFETSELRTHRKPVFKKYDVIHYCVPNIASRVAHTSSIALSNIFTPWILEIGESGGVEKMMQRNPWFMKGAYAFRGKLTNAGVAKKLGMQYSDISLLLAGL
ncbi:alanine dehydrogenase [Thermonema rossianum]|uniref:alanine dehydrogenase n=1 Tax=Thermonema rossianum TaxID=55505 RepID=UPI00056EB880|nr:alanine dehydrogenase [Thermonema rossianum]